MKPTNVIPMFAQAVAERAADRVVPPPLAQPQSLTDYSTAAQLQLARDKRTNMLGTCLAIAVGFGGFFLVRDWRSRQRQRRAKGST